MTKLKRLSRTPRQKLASSHNWLLYKLQATVVSGLNDIAEAKTLTRESRKRIEEVEWALGRLKESLRRRKDQEDEL